MSGLVEEYKAEMPQLAKDTWDLGVVEGVLTSEQSARGLHWFASCYRRFVYIHLFMSHFACFGLIMVNLFDCYILDCGK